MTNPPTITVAVPAYARPQELEVLMDSILAGNAMPDELLIAEDHSPERDSVRAVVEGYRARFADTPCRLTYIENIINLGYDGNLREIISRSQSDYVILLGNDDALLPNAVTEVQCFIKTHPQVKFISRTYTRFVGEVSNVINTTWISKKDFVFSSKNTSANIIFRLCGFVGGLIINRNWAENIKTQKYDGSLYYQFYLASKAFFDDGVGYISKSIVAGRAGNPPLFGASNIEKADHVPGSYQPKGRAKMWAGVLQIAADLEIELGVSLVKEIKKEMSGRQAFHIFEMMPSQERNATLQLLFELRKLGLTNSYVPWILALYVMIFGRYSKYGFLLFRKFQFFIEKNIRIKI